MTTILSWNIQNGLGVDGQRSLSRIASVIRAHGPADVLCLQEVSSHMPLDPDARAPDQVAELSALFPEYTPVFGPAFSMMIAQTGQLAQYGNLILSRLPVQSAFLHALPQPAQSGLKQMPRQAVEVTVASAQGLLRVMTTHLEFHSVQQRLAQIEAFKAIHQAADALTHNPPKASAFGPYRQLDRAALAVLCGDFNCLPDSEELATLTAPSAAGTSALVEAWSRLSPGQPHKPTCGIYDGAQWPQGAHCRDYFVVSERLAERIISVQTDTVTDASDHQPVQLTMQRY